jgi:hypothetical protein
MLPPIQGPDVRQHAGKRRPAVPWMPVDVVTSGSPMLRRSEEAQLQHDAEPVLGYMQL